MLIQSGEPQIPFRITNPERIPTARYHDPEFFDLERQRLWPHVWQMACRLEEIPNVGDYVEYRILNRSVLVVRTKAGIKAFHNVCRHRGVKLASGRGNCRTKGFICPFHGWRWNMDGENTFVFGRQIFSEENLEQAELNLAPCRVELWGGSAFINFDDDAPSLIDALGPVAERLSARNLDQLRMEWWYATELPTNWSSPWTPSWKATTRCAPIRSSMRCRCRKRTSTALTTGCRRRGRRPPRIWWKPPSSSWRG